MGEPKCKTCGDTWMVRTDTPADRYWFCGCRSHTWCPDCTPRLVRWIESLYLWWHPVQ